MPVSSLHDLRMNEGKEAGGSTSGTAGSPPRWHGVGLQVAVGMILGVVVGLIWPDFGASLKILGEIFLRLVKMVVAPLVFLTVTLGFLAAGDFKKMGKIGLISLIYFEVVSTLALLWGFSFGVLFRVGEGVGHVDITPAAVRGAAAVQQSAVSGPTPAGRMLLEIVPDNFLGAFVRGEALQVLVLAILFGAALLTLRPIARAPLEKGLRLIAPAFYQFTNVIMRMAPLGAFGAMAYAVGSNGMGVLMALGWWVVAYWITQFLWVVVALGAICWFAKASIFDILRFIKDEIVIVLGTASSESVLPRLLEKLPRYGVSEQATGVVLPTGYVFNLDGSAIYLSMSVIFVMNAFHVDLTNQQLIGIFLLMLLTGKGVATVTGGSFVTFAQTAAASGVLPLSALPMMFGVYRAMAPANSTCNAISNSVATIVIAKLCGEFEPERKTLEMELQE